MKPRLPPTLAMTTLLLLAGVGMQAPAAAQTQTKSSTLYRCGPDGRELRDSPCPDGKPGAAGPSQLQYEQPSAAQTAAAQAQAARQAQVAQEMERDRLTQEARDHQANARAGGIDGLKGIAQGSQSAHEPKSTAGQSSHKRKAPKAAAKRKQPRLAKPALPNATNPGAP